jgi:hypothetical protein
MTYSNLERRVTELEAWVADIDYSYRESMNGLRRACLRNELEMGMLIQHANRVGRGVALILERMGVRDCRIPEMPAVTDEEVDLMFETTALAPAEHQRIVRTPAEGDSHA